MRSPETPVPETPVDINSEVALLVTDCAHAADRADLKKKLRARLERKFPSAAFVPNGKQSKFMRAVGRGAKPNFALLGGNGAGKSAVGVNLLCQIIYGAHGWFQSAADLPLFRDWADPVTGKPWPKVAWIVGTPTNLKDGGGIRENLLRYLAPGTYTEEKGGKEFVSIYRFPAYGWTIRCFTDNQEAKELEGPTIGLVWCDEPVPEAFLGPITSRLRMGGITFHTLTPLEGAAWLDDLYVAQDPDWYFLQVDIEDACVEHGVRGHLDHTHIERIVAGYPAYEREARKSGGFLSSQGRVYPEWGLDNIIDHPREIVEWELANSQDPPTIYCVLDPHLSKPWVITWWAVYRDGRKICFMESPDDTMPPYHETEQVSFGYDYYVELFREKERKLAVYKRIVDARFGKQSMLARHGVVNIIGELDESSGGALRFMPNQGVDDDNRGLVMQHISGTNMVGDEGTGPLILCDRSCKNLDHAMRHHRWIKNRGRALDDKPRLSRKVAERFKCFPNTLEYLMGAKASWVMPEEWLYVDDDGGVSGEFPLY